MVEWQKPQDVQSQDVPSEASVPSVSQNVKEAKLTTEDDPIDAFLIEQHKKSVSDEIRQRKREEEKESLG